MIEPGTKVDDLLGVDENGKEIRLSDYPGKSVALYFYPKDSTPGCTAEACSIRDSYEKMLAEGIQPIGVSVDSAASHKRFREKNNLQFPLITDADHKLVERFGVWGEKKMCGRTYMGTIRTTFIINPEGVVTKVFGPKEIKTKVHAEQILGE